MSGLEAIRDEQLDLNNKQEILRPELDYPETLQSYNSYMADVFERKTIRSGVKEEKALEQNLWVTLSTGRADRVT